MKHPFVSLLVLSVTMLPGAAALYIGPAPGDWNTASNWDTSTVPAISAGVPAVINNGATVDYPATPLGDLNVNAGGVLTISGGSRLKTDQTNWSQVNNGTMILDGGIFSRGTTGNLVGSQVAGVLNAPTTSVITATNSSTIEMIAPGASNLILGYTNFTNATLNLTDSTVRLGGELWLGSNTTTDSNQVAAVNINNSSIFTGGAVGLWVWDYAAAGSSMAIHFSGPAGSFIDVTDSIGIRANATGANNASTWESLWALGLLTAQNQSGLTGANFSSYFVTTGTAVRDAAPYRLTLIPEPSATALALVTGALFAGRRRRDGRV